jgi:hypothetical protein
MNGMLWKSKEIMNHDLKMWYTSLLPEHTKQNFYGCFFYHEFAYANIGQLKVNLHVLGNTFK